MAQEVRRIFSEKKLPFAVEARGILKDVKSDLGISTLEAVRVFNRYDVSGITDDEYEEAKKVVFSEPPVDNVYDETIDVADACYVLGIEALPGQYDQRADSAVQCVQFLDENENPIIRTAVTYMIIGNITDEEFDRIKSHCINPVDSRETGLEKPETLVTNYDDPADVKIFDGFIAMDGSSLKSLYESLGLAMTFNDFLHIKNYFTNEEKRDPSMTEIRVLDTYWSDHCRHTTFLTELKDIKIRITHRDHSKQNGRYRSHDLRN